ncbi:hypothetical protein Pmar_PMAR022751 [Perkinsus marinus ATCC 50983]|uniref:Uncharacterized protein n=1 Tax=Perkinsus marinus (strain ATCC 50983 / TXsc) TaxID=423536 RepID=C5LTH4_PERM5|nr:hypothetical protein Pmar_PMAR022751 [Perkinsus marinus ATCC 50983]EEQ99965.1 hypothetical protein Pmar_PMAR022751 [Perkinsus marinus ATCC 50983]|eukprot:XP_002767248.1 hypothetical protein Pmar_PMAR022751 [Perkinsus marinus ATCC 50983]
MENSSSATPPPTRRLSVIKEGTEVSAGHSSRSTPPALRRQVSPPQTDARSWYDGERTPSSPSLPRINPADYGCGVPEDDGGFTTDVERGLAGEEDIGSSSSDDEASNESGSDEDSSSESSTSAYEIVQRGDEIVRRKRRKKREPARDLEFIDWSEEFNTGIIATAHEPTLRFKKVVTRRFGAKLRGHPMFREDVQRQEQENGDKTHVAELQM